MFLCACPPALVPCWDGLRLWFRLTPLLPTVLLASLLVHDAALVLVALLRPSSVSAVYLALCLLGYQGTSSSKVTGGRLARLAALLDSLSPLATLGRGYAILSDEAGAILRRAQDTSAGEAVRARLAEGRLALRVESVEEDDR